jgi:lipid II:glycine glycyltransferase (peptidoglycan interpeptide bridge formation enzyme)
MGIVVTAKCKERPVASAIFFDSKTEGVYKFGASDTAFQALRGNNLVMWEAIKWLVRQGKKALDFGRTSRSNEGLRRYKLSWGAEERTIRYLKFDLRRQAFITDRDDTQGWHVRVFRALPTVLARMLGASLYKHIA